MSDSDETANLLLFLRAPQLGMVKTRLSQVLDEAFVLDLYRCFVEDIIDTLSDCGYPITLCYFPPGERKAVSDWLGNDFGMMQQSGKDLGERMAAAFEDVFTAGCNRAVLIGSDFPDLDSNIIHEAIDGLSRYDSVIGPAVDGGYYLIGMRADTYNRQIFHGIPWGKSVVFNRTLERMEQIGMTRHMLSEWRDIDRYDDLYHFWQQLSDPPVSAHRTSRLLAGHFMPPIVPDPLADAS